MWRTRVTRRDVLTHVVSWGNVRLGSVERMSTCKEVLVDRTWLRDQSRILTPTGVKKRGYFTTHKDSPRGPWEPKESQHVILYPLLETHNLTLVLRWLEDCVHSCKESSNRVYKAPIVASERKQECKSRKWVRFSQSTVLWANGDSQELNCNENNRIRTSNTKK